MSDASQFKTTETLRNGLVVTIRAVRPDDKAAVVAAFAHLDAESLYTRFFRVKTTLTEQDLRAATEVDFKDVVALVVTIESGGREIIIGGGRFAAFDAGGTRRAEIAFLVEEDYHGLGLAGRVLRHLTELARAAGVQQFEAEVLPQNQAMLAVFSRSGLPLELTAADGATHVRLALTAPA